MKISIRYLREYLSPGTEFSASHLFNVDKTPAKRLVVSQTAHQMISRILDGPKAGNLVYCTWRHVSATMDEQGNVELTDSSNSGPAATHGKPFLRITDVFQTSHS